MTREDELNELIDSMDSSELTHDQEEAEISTCDYCGEPTKKLFEVEDVDAATGYDAGVIWVCEFCHSGRKR